MDTSQHISLWIIALGFAFILGTIHADLDDANKMLWDIDYKMSQEQGFVRWTYPEDPTVEYCLYEDGSSGECYPDQIIQYDYETDCQYKSNGTCLDDTRLGA